MVEIKNLRVGLIEFFPSWELSLESVLHREIVFAETIVVLRHQLYKYKSLSLGFDTTRSSNSNVNSKSKYKLKFKDGEDCGPNMRVP